MSHDDAIAVLRAAGVDEHAYGVNTVARDEAYILYAKPRIVG